MYMYFHIIFIQIIWKSIQSLELYSYNSKAVYWNPHHFGITPNPIVIAEYLRWILYKENQLDKYYGCWSAQVTCRPSGGRIMENWKQEQHGVD